MIKEITLKKNKIRFILLDFILKSILFFFKKKKKKSNFNKISNNSFYLFSYHLKLLIMRNIFDYASIF
jgi:hypothetical protein